MPLGCAPDKGTDSGFDSGVTDSGVTDTGESGDTGDSGDTDTGDTGDTDTGGCMAWPDDDGDGYGDDAAPLGVYPCDSPPEGTLDHGGDCDDADPLIHPGVLDVACDNIDQDCDGATDGGWRVPEDQGDIQVAMNSAPEGSTICVGPGTYVTGLDFLGRELHVIGREGPDRTIIDAHAAFSAVTFTHREGAASILEGFTISNGYAAEGAGLHITNASPTLRNLVIRDNVCEDFSSAGLCTGGGVWISGGSPLFEDVVIRDNRQHAAGNLGGGVYINAGTPVFTRVEVTGNRQEGAGVQGGMAGAGVYVYNASATLDGIVVSGNVQSYTDASVITLDGAGIYVLSYTGDWSDVTITDNEQTCAGSGCNASGAGLYVGGPSVLTIDGATIAGNTATSTAASPRGYGPGISAYADVDLTLRNATVSDNHVVTPENTGGGEGGGLYGRTDVNLVLENVLLAGNSVTSADSKGAGMCLQEYCTAQFTNVIIAGNTIAGTGTGRGAGIFMANNAVHLTQVDVVGNTCTTPMCRGVGFNVYSNATLTFDGVNVVDNQGTHDRTDGGALCGEYTGNTFTAVWSNLYGNASSEIYGLTTPPVADGNVFVDPLYTSTAGADPTLWDLTLQPSSPVRDAGNTASSDPDGSRADIGAWGGAGAAAW